MYMIQLENSKTKNTQNLAHILNVIDFFLFTYLFNLPVVYYIFLG